MLARAPNLISVDDEQRTQPCSSIKIAGAFISTRNFFQVARLPPLAQRCQTSARLMPAFEVKRNKDQKSLKS